MKNYIPGAILALSFVVVSPEVAFAQWDYNDHIIDNIVMDRAARRRSEGRAKGSKSGRRTTSAKRKSAARNTGASAVKPVAPALPRYAVVFSRDTYQDFHLDDINGFRVDFTFTDTVTGKTITKFHVYNYYNVESEIEGVPAGVYTVRATALYKGKTYQAHLGTGEGSTDNPRGGDFAPSMKVELKREIDANYGTPIMNIYPKSLYVRVID